MIARPVLMADQQELPAYFTEAIAAGLPVVKGEPTSLSLLRYGIY